MTVYRDSACELAELVRPLFDGSGTRAELLPFRLPPGSSTKLSERLGEVERMLRLTGDARGEVLDPKTSRTPDPAGLG